MLGRKQNMAIRAVKGKSGARYLVDDSETDAKESKDFLQGIQKGQSSQNTSETPENSEKSTEK